MTFRKNWLSFMLACPVLAVTLATHPPEACSQSQPAVSLETSNSSAKTIVPRLIKFSGTLLDEQAQPMKSPVGVTFALYAQQSGSAALWMETQNVETDAKGNYTVLLGANSASGVPVELFDAGEARWLGVQAERQAEQPRVLLVSVPYALKAGDAQTLGGLPPSAFAPASSVAGTSSSSSTPALLLASPGASTTAAAAPLATSMSVTTPGGTANFIPLWTTGTTLGNSILFQSTGSNVNVNGSLALPAVNTATVTAGSNSQALDLFASSFNSTPAPGAAVAQHFRWQAEPVNNNTTNSSGRLNLLFASGTGTPAETGLSISNKGLITFASGQTLPTISGNETVTGNLSAAQLVSTVATGTAPLSVKSTTMVPNLNANFLDGIPASALATLGANTFAGTQSINGNLALAQTTGATMGVVTMGSKSFIHSCCVGIATDNTFVGPGAGNFSLGINAGGNTALGARALAADTSGFGNTAIGSDALRSNTTGVQNVAIGIAALIGNTGGLINTAVGLSALGGNTTGKFNAALGGDALAQNGTGSNNTAMGFNAGVTSSAGNANTSGSNNTFLGYQAGPGTPTQLTNATAIGANALVSASNSLVLGGTGANAVKVGIGTATPGATLDVNGPANFSGPVTFAAGQTFPGGTVVGNETVQGNVSASGQLISTVATGTAPLSVTSTTQVTNLNASLLGGLSAGAFAQLAAVNNFTANQNVNGTLTVNGPVNATGGRLNVQGLQQTLLGNTGCGGAFGGIGFGANSLADCTHYSLLGEGVHTYLNRPLGGQILFREGNSTEMVLAAGGSLGIGTTTPAYLLHVNGTMRAETGLSLGGNAVVNVDAPGTVGGHFTVQANGNVGINNPSPAATLDVGGSVKINGDGPMSSLPHMFFSGTFPGSFCGDASCGNPGSSPFPAGGLMFAERSILITRILVSSIDTIDPSCIPAKIGIWVNPFSSPAAVTFALPQSPSAFFSNFQVSPPLSVPAGSSAWVGLAAATVSCNVGSAGGGNAFANVEYVMQ
jgi:hypothetical protein